MSFWTKVFGAKESATKEPAKAESTKTEPKPSAPAGSPLSQAVRSAGYKPIDLPRSENAIVDSIVQSMMARQTCETDNTFETGEKNPQSILCSDDACPCTDRSQLVIGRTAYLYISPEVVNFRKNCKTLLERNMMLKEMTKTMGAHVFLGGGVANPFYLCETGARRRGLDLAVAMRDAKMVAETGFAPLRPTPKAAGGS